MTKINGTNNSNQSKITLSSSSKSEKNLPKQSLFIKLDKNKDGQISDEELYNAGYRDKDLMVMSEALFFAQRNVNKWFTLDKNKNGTTDNIEVSMWGLHNNNPDNKIEDYSPEEFAKMNNLIFDGKNYDDMKSWCDSWITDKEPMCGIKAMMKERYGKELTDDETQLLYDTMKFQMNKWLFKQDSLYNNLPNTSYTRLATMEQTVSCCGGNIDKPPIGPQNPEEGCAMIFSSMDNEGAVNSAYEVKNRLAWAMFRTIVQEQVQNMSPMAYRRYQAQWNEIRDMKASDFRELLKPENQNQRKIFENNSLMSVRQIVEYIDIIESVTGKDFDSEDWNLNQSDFMQVMEKMNGTYGDDKILQGKTRADIPADRQELLKYLEEHNLLLDQFK